MMEEEAQGEKHLIRIMPQGEEKEPKMLVTWQYIWDRNICVLFSAIGEDGIEQPRRFLLLGDSEKGSAKDCLDQMVTAMEEELKKVCGDADAQAAVSDRNPKRKMGFLK